MLARRRYTIKQLPPELRPRERLLAVGPSALSDSELLGLLFGIGSREKTAVELAGEVGCPWVVSYPVQLFTT